VAIDFLPGVTPLPLAQPEQGILQTTALKIQKDNIAAIYVMRNPDKLRHLTIH